MGWASDLWNNVERIANDVRDWAEDLADDVYGWFGIESENGNVRVDDYIISDDNGDFQIRYQPKPPELNLSDWSDVLNPNAMGRGQYFGTYGMPVKAGITHEISCEFTSSPGSPARGVTFIGHAPSCVFSNLRVALSNVAFTDDPTVKAGFSVRLVQRDFDGKPLFVNGLPTTVTDDGVVYREDLRIPARTPFVFEQFYGGEMLSDLPMFITCAPYGDVNAVPGMQFAKVHVTASLLYEPVPVAGVVGGV